MYTIVHYLDASERDIYQDWIDSLKDRVAKIAIIRRVARLELGAFGDCKYLRDGMSELRINVGAGYRVYYANVGNMTILLTCGGDKGSQERDIRAAVKLLEDWENRYA